MWVEILLVPVRNFERILRASFRLGTRAAHGLDTPVLAASGRLRAPRQSGVKHELIGPPPGRPRAPLPSNVIRFRVRRPR